MPFKVIKHGLVSKSDKCPDCGREIDYLVSEKGQVNKKVTFGTLIGENQISCFWCEAVLEVETIVARSGELR